ncbi:MAG: bifunctional phosphopantothenoylcysteine decarboxylase/phosphopantothenate--cysteine ligase CoaBC [Candidatus Levybacteria bacterium]|nr:bifunctional phosphopantothenoylcysteine decarboxylase/phosphopantothenate--cysteine ligase CoaBC [Candidatus Levybacteria bacterium]
MKKQTIAVGVTSGIAAYKTLNLVQLLKKKGYEVVVIMTKAATQMVAKKEFEKASGNKVFTDLFPPKFDYKKILKERTVDHIAIADSASVFVVAPATANVIAKIANGLADDFLTTTILAVHSPIVLCPSMNLHMWENPIVQENLERLRSSGFILLDPEEGNLACGYRGRGRLVDVEKIASVIEKIAAKKKLLEGKRVLVTAGATQEPIDDVRFITNKSTGKMGAAIADVAFLLGAKVTLLRAASFVSARFPIREELFETGEDLAKLLQNHVANSDIVFHSAAVGDFAVLKKRKGKISSSRSHTLELTPTVKIINMMKKQNPNVFLVGFKAVWGGSQKEFVRVARAKLKESNADAIVVNDVSRKDTGFAVDTNEAYVVKASGDVYKIELTTKDKVAREIIACLFAHL